MKLQCVLVGGVPDRTGGWYRRAAGRGHHRSVMSRPVWKRMENYAIWKIEDNILIKDRFSTKFKQNLAMIHSILSEHNISLPILHLHNPQKVLIKESKIIKNVRLKLVQN